MRTDALWPDQGKGWGGRNFTKIILPCHTTMCLSCRIKQIKEYDSEQTVEGHNNFKFMFVNIVCVSQCNGGKNFEMGLDIPLQPTEYVPSKKVESFFPRKRGASFSRSIVSRFLWRRHFTFRVQQLFWGKDRWRAQVRRHKKCSFVLIYHFTSSPTE